MSNRTSRQDAKTPRAFIPSVFFASLRLCVSICLLSSATHAQLRSPTDAAVATAASLRNGLVSYWTLDESSGTRADSVGTNHLGQTGTVPAIRGKLVNSSSNNASSIRLSTPGRAPDLTGDMSIALWFNLTTTNSSYQTLIAKDDGTARGFYCTQSQGYSSNALFFSRWTVLGSGGSGRFYDVVPAVWTHIVMVYSVSNVLGYRNGTNYWDSTVTNNNWISVVTPWTLLSHGGGVGFYLNGCVDEVAIYNRALSPAEVHRLYAYGRGTRWPFLVSPPANP